MKKNLRFHCVFLLFFSVTLEAFSQPVLIHGKTNDFSRTNKTIPVDVILFSQSDNGSESLVYQESNTVRFRDSGRYEVLMGKGIKKGESNSVDSIIWNLDEFKVLIQEKSDSKLNKPFHDNILLRKEIQSSSFKQEGMVEKSDFETYGTFEIPLQKKSVPKKITLDFTSSYINVNYPGGRYPIYRHYEWFQTTMNSKGNCFMLTYSEKNTHEFWQNTDKFGDVRIHDKPFQELRYEMMPDKIKVVLTKPEQVKYLSETYGIKGPWKIIYLIEWE